MLLTPFIFVYSIYRPKNASNEIQYITNHKTQCITSITPACFGTGVPSSGSPINNWRIILGLWFFVFVDSLKMALWCRNT